MNKKHVEFIPQVNPGAAYLALKDEIDSAFQRAVESGWYILGKEVENFETEFASYIRVSYGVGVASGTDAIEIALRCCDTGPGDLVFTVSHTAVATVAAIGRCGAKPVFVDIDPKTFTMDPGSLEDTILSIISGRLSVSGRPKAVIPVHLYGHPADMKAILDISQKFGLYVIEDCAQAHGAELNGKRLGSFGDLAAFSFYPTKNLGAMGDGGIVVTNSQQFQHKLMALRQYGWVDRYVSSVPGINSRLDELQAAILCVKLKHLDSDNERRKNIAQRYTKEIANTPFCFIEPADNVEHVYHQYVIMTSHRESLMDHLKRHSIGSAIHYPLPVHLQPAYKDNAIIGEGGLPATEKVYRKILSLPMYPQMTEDFVERVVFALKSWRK